MIRIITLLLLLALAIPGHASTLTVPTGTDAQVNGDSFQAAVNTANCGDTVLLQAAASYQTRVLFVNSYGPQGNPFFLPNKNCSPGQSVTIQSSSAAALPAGVRVTPAQRNQMAQLASNSNSWVIEPAAGAGSYTFIGIEFTHTANVAAQGGFSPDVVFLSQNEAAYGAWGHDMTLDRCLVWPYEEWAAPTSRLRSAAVGVRVDGVNQTVINSWVGGFTGLQSDDKMTPVQSTGIESVAGPGPILIRNNFIEAWYSNVFTGGGSGYVDPTHTSALAASTLTSATLLTNAQNVAVGDAIAFQVPPFTNAHGLSTAWASGTVTAVTGSVVTFAPLGDASPAPPMVPGWARWNGLNVTGVTLVRNTLNKRPEWQDAGYGIAKSYWEYKSLVDSLIEGNRFVGPGTNIMGGELNNQNGSSPWVSIKNVIMRNNLILATGGLNMMLGPSYYGQGAKMGGPITFTNNLMVDSPLRVEGMVNGLGPIVFTHNTIFGITANMWRQDALPGTPGLVYRDNIIASGRYWLEGWPGTFPGAAKDHNVIINNSGSAIPPGYETDFIVPSYDAIGFVNLAGVLARGDYHGYALSDTSPFKGRASDGTNPGVDFAALDAALAGSTPPPPPPPTFLIGDAIQTTTALNVRTAPGVSSPLAGAPQPGLTLGTVLEGPVVLSGQEWYRIDYRSGTDGWSWKGPPGTPYLRLAPSPPIPDFHFLVPSGKTYQINNGPVVTVP